MFVSQVGLTKRVRPSQLTVTGMIKEKGGFSMTMTDDEKITKILAAASDLFIQPGYQVTQMQTIARHAHLAVGSLYRFFSSKAALRDQLFLTTLGVSVTGTTLPLTTVDQTQLLAQTQTAYDQWQEQFQSCQRADDLDDLLTNLVTTFQRYGRYFLILEQNPTLNPALTALYRDYRQRLYQQVGEFLMRQRRTATEADGMIVVDLIFWWCAHKQYDSFEKPVGRQALPAVLIQLRTMLHRSY